MDGSDNRIAYVGHNYENNKWNIVIEITVGDKLVQHELFQNLRKVQCHF